MSAAATVVEALERAFASSTRGYRFIDDRGKGERFVDYATLQQETAHFGGALQCLGARVGDRVALIIPDNADFVFAFLGAVRAGLVPVPIYPPAGLRRLEGYLANTLHIVRKSGARFLVTTNPVRALLGTVQLGAPELEQVVGVETIRKMGSTLEPARPAPSDPCFLQFTSGSTSQPKGVIVTHGNLVANDQAFMVDGIRVSDEDSGVSWLPLYHDMGLIGFVFAPMFHVVDATFIPPLLFLKRPAQWLQVLSRVRGTVSFAPNFAYALCVKRIREEELAGVDLSAWRVAGCGAEPIRAENLLRFADRFASKGFRREAILPCYGMAESTLAISFDDLGEGVRTEWVDGERLAAQGRAELAEESSAGALPIVCCGRPFPGHEIACFDPADPSNDHPLADRQVGEIRMHGPSVCAGYFNDPEKTAEAFVGGWLRSGDLGYVVDGRLYVCGRSKELVIVNGRNYYPQDIEWEVSQIEGIRKGNVIAFGIPDATGESEQVVVTFETAVVDSDSRSALAVEARRRVQQVLGLTLADVVALAPGVLPKTSSGKLKRREARELYISDALVARTSIRKSDPLGVAKELARSQLAYLKGAFRGRGKHE